jgi:hypothetical protein
MSGWGEIQFCRHLGLNFRTTRRNRIKRRYSITSTARASSVAEIPRKSIAPDRSAAAHHAVDRRIGAPLDHLGDGLTLDVIELGRVGRWDLPFTRALGPRALKRNTQSRMI